MNRATVVILEEMGGRFSSLQGINLREYLE